MLCWTKLVWSDIMVEWRSASPKRPVATGSGEARPALSSRTPPRRPSRPDPEPVLLVLHVMPTHYRKDSRP
jgi:hypothetical protein